MMAIRVTERDVMFLNFRNPAELAGHCMAVAAQAKATADVIIRELKKEKIVTAIRSH